MTKFVEMNEEISNKFGKSERLRHKMLVDMLFERGRNAYEYPLRLVWHRLDSETLETTFRKGMPPKIGNVQVMFTVPKKKQKRAVDRVQLRRRMREAYRLSRHELLEFVHDDPDLRLVMLSFIYTADEKHSYAEIKQQMEKLLQRVKNRLCEEH